MQNQARTYPVSCHPFIVTDAMLRQRALARAAKARRDPGAVVIAKALVEQVKVAVGAFEAPRPLGLAVWIGRADRLAGLAAEGLLSDLAHGPAFQEPAAPDGLRRLHFVTARGPRAYWPEAEAAAYLLSLEALRDETGGVEGAAAAARALVIESKSREARWSADEILYRLTAGVVEWVFWDEAPLGERPAAAGRDHGRLPGR